MSRQGPCPEAIWSEAGPRDRAVLQQGSVAARRGVQQGEEEQGTGCRGCRGCRGAGIT